MIGYRREPGCQQVDFPGLAALLRVNAGPPGICDMGDHGPKVALVDFGVRYPEVKKVGADRVDFGIDITESLMQTRP